MTGANSRKFNGPVERSIAVVIPCYRAAKSIGKVLSEISPLVERIYCVDDASPDNTAEIIADLGTADLRIRLIRRRVNGGVGAASLDGYRAAIAGGAAVLVKIDADGQMDPAFVLDFAAPILAGHADYVKGNRFFDLETVRSMPIVRIIGNAGLSFLTKLSTGYWDLFDPTNGYTAIHADVAAALPLDRLHRRYFFESDLLFRLGVARARIVELPIVARYGDESSRISELRCLVTFPWLHLRNFGKRIFYNYYLRNFSLASVNLALGILLAVFGLAFGIDQWLSSYHSSTAATAGTVMLSALPLLLGAQLVLSFLSHDMAMTPQQPIHKHIEKLRILSAAAANRATGSADESGIPQPPHQRAHDDVDSVNT